jgi:hypothetical protein
MVPFADPVVDWGALGKVIAAALVTGIGVTGFFSVAILGATRSVEMRRSGRGAGASVYAAVGVIGAAVCVAAVVLGIIVMTSK